MPTDPSTATWRKASRSAHGDDCVEVSDLGIKVGVRDSKNPAGGNLAFPRPAWAVFAAQVKGGRHDLAG